MKNEANVVGHTPGEWSVGMGLKIYPDKIHGMGGAIAQVSNIKHGYKTMEANARLIAAAPELLEACKHAVDGLEKTGQVGRAHIVKQAIAKAEGK